MWWGESIAPLILNFCTTFGEGQLHTQATLSPWKESIPFVIGGWVGPRADLEILLKNKPFVPARNRTSLGRMSTAHAAVHTVHRLHYLAFRLTQNSNNNADGYVVCKLYSGEAALRGSVQNCCVVEGFCSELLVLLSASLGVESFIMNYICWFFFY
jgi:hypothetical protein